jgi:hypothetical protein
MHMKSDYIVLGGAVATILLFGAIFFYAPEAEVVSFGPIDVGGGSITVEDQENQDVVTLDAELVVSGYITIHESMGQAPAALVGTSRYLEAGTHKGLMINLTEPMSLGSPYRTLLHVDNGDQIFVPEDDRAVKNGEETVKPSYTFIGISSGQELSDDAELVNPDDL